MCSFCLLLFFAGDIGGQMGLFIGASILTILELFDYAYEVRLKLLLPHFCSHIPDGTSNHTHASLLCSHSQFLSVQETKNIFWFFSEEHWHKKQIRARFTSEPTEMKDPSLLPLLYSVPLFRASHAALSCTGVWQGHTVIVFTSPRVLEIHRKSNFQEIFFFLLLFNGHNGVMAIRNPRVADISSSNFYQDSSWNN